MVATARSLREVRHSLLERCKQCVKKHKHKSLHAPVIEPRIVDGSVAHDMEYVLSGKSYTPEVQRTVGLET